MLWQCLELAKQCEPTATAYNVGCIITDADGQVLSRGYSRELPGNTHAEQCALSKMMSDKGNLVLYSTMEPCSERLSGNKPCAQRIIDFGRMSKVVIAVKEPPTFIEQCQGVDLLEQAGIAVDYSGDKALQEECLRVAKLGH